MPKKYIVLDTETTGLEVKQGHRIIEIGAVLVNNRVKSDQHFHSYLNPQRSIDEKALKFMVFLLNHSKISHSLKR